MGCRRSKEIIYGRIMFPAENAFLREALIEFSFGMMLVETEIRISKTKLVIMDKIF